MGEICQEVVNLLKEKQKSYNNSYKETRDEFGSVVFLIRLTDKLNRLKSIVKNKQEFFGESYEDTIKDIIGYCLLELSYMEGFGDEINR